MLTLAVSCFGSGPWLGNGAEVSASLCQQQSNRTQETPPWPWEAAALIYQQLKSAQFIKTTAKLTANCLLSYSHSTHTHTHNSLASHLRLTTLLKEPCCSSNSRPQAQSLKNKLQIPVGIPETLTLINSLKTCRPQPVASPFHKAQWTDDRHTDTGLLPTDWYDRTLTFIAHGWVPTASLKTVCYA